LIKGRPIVGATNFITTKTSILLEKVLQSKIRNNENIVIDSQDMASHLDKLTISANEVFVLLDIVSLYPNINTKHLIECMNEDPDIENITTELTDFILGHAFFEYQEKCFQQISGIPVVVCG